MSNLNSNLDVIFSKMENFITAKTVVGDPVHIGDVIIVPLTDVSFGIGAGAGYSLDNDKKTENDGGGGGGGANITTSAVIVIMNGTVQLVNVKNQDSLNKLIDLVPGIVSKMQGLFNKKKNQKDEFTQETIYES